MEEWDRVDAATNLYSQPVAVTGRKYLRHRPGDCFILFYLPNLWLSLVGGIRTIARLNCSFVFLCQPEVASRHLVDFTLPYGTAMRLLYAHVCLMD